MKHVQKNMRNLDVNVILINIYLLLIQNNNKTVKIMQNDKKYMSFNQSFLNFSF